VDKRIGLFSFDRLAAGGPGNPIKKATKAVEKRDKAILKTEALKTAEEANRQRREARIEAAKTKAGKVKTKVVANFKKTRRTELSEDVPQSIRDGVAGFDQKLNTLGDLTTRYAEVSGQAQHQTNATDRQRVSRELRTAENNIKKQSEQELIPTLDDIDRALEVMPDSPDHRNLRREQRKMLGALRQLGVEHYAPVGEQFDPHWHESIESRPNTGLPSGMIIEVRRPGYRFGNRLVRAASVIIAE
jgi:molecular chaperone GrpE